MTLEATMILLDNSNWARNGDYYPTRWDAQVEVVEKLVEVKLQSNPENTVGLITMAGSKVDVLLTPAVKERVKFMASLHKIQMKGKIQLSNSLNIAQLTLKHRQNTNQKQRIVAFIASPVEEDAQELQKIAKKLRKEVIAVDIIHIGSRDPEQIEKLRTFVQAINKDNNSNYSYVEPSLDGNLLLSLQDSQLFGDFAQGMEDIGDMDDELQRAIKESEITAAQEKQKRDETVPSGNTQSQQQVIQIHEEEPKQGQMEIEKSTGNQEQTKNEQELIKQAKEITEKQHENQDQQIQDPEFLQSLFQQSGINLDQEEITNALKQAQDKEGDKKGDKKEEEKK